MSPPREAKERGKVRESDEKGKKGGERRWGDSKLPVDCTTFDRVSLSNRD